MTCPTRRACWPPGRSPPGFRCPAAMTPACTPCARSRTRWRWPGAAVRRVVVGSGFIGCEAAASLAMRGVAVTLVSDEPLPQAARLGEEVAERLAAWLHEAGVRLLCDEAVERFDRRGDGWSVVTSGSAVQAPHGADGGGREPAHRYRRGGGLALAGGAVAADASMRSSAPGVFVAGDVAYAEQRRRRPAAAGGALGRGPAPGRGGRHGGRRTARTAGRRRPASGARSGGGR